ncbi:MAG TPA: hypothetical protein VFW35_02285 [Sphingomicrobium sp.]|nr:hypothetical protein [Sphingomicrobium sp.]
MVGREECALDVLLFGAKDEELIDIKCFRGDREDVSPEDIKAAIHSGLMQHKLRPDLASKHAPALGVEPRDVKELVGSLSAVA